MHYAIGDVQGCYVQLQRLLALIQFNERCDTLWFTGDLVNRGPDSLAVLRLVKSLGSAACTVLGNHDLHLLAIYHGHQELQPQDTLQAVLEASDVDDLCRWLQRQPLLHYDEQLQYVLVHAGIAPMWTVAKARQLAQEVTRVMNAQPATDFWRQLYGDTPNCWDERLTGGARWRLIVNYFTRMRFCNAQGCLDLRNKSKPGTQSTDYMPWFRAPQRQTVDDRIIFGHWAALEGKTQTDNIFALDTGCVWGGRLTAMRLSDRQLFSVAADE
jgi:bis(5'-nucleosyl)-tetraphosphatase (symmetrical)